MMASRDKRAIATEKHATDLLKYGPVYYPKSCSTRKGGPFEEYFKLVHTDKRPLKSAYGVIAEYQSDSYSADSDNCECQSKDTNDAYRSYCCVYTFVRFWCTQLPLLLI